MEFPFVRLQSVYHKTDNFHAIIMCFKRKKKHEIELYEFQHNPSAL